MNGRALAEKVRSRTRVRGQSRNTVEALAHDIDRHGQARRDGIRQRLSVVTETLGGAPVPTGTDQLDTAVALHALIQRLQPLTPQRAWLMLTAISGELPDADLVRTAVRTAATDGPVAAIRLAVWSGPLPRVLDRGNWRPVEIITNAVVVDVHHTAQTDFATGIQRVTREATRRWMDQHRPTLIGWSADLRSLRALSAPEVRRACWGGPAVEVPTDDPIVVPWNCTYLLPELAAEPARTTGLLALSQYSGSTLNLIGYDLVPLTTGETSHEGMLAGFARTLAACRYAGVIAPISEAASVEYRGWRAMLSGAGLPGPDITTVPLAVQSASAGSPSEQAASDRAAADRLILGGLPMVLVVGSHEPRKNHLAVLHAAELLWREGLRFSLTFIGGNSWNSDRFTDGMTRLQAAGRPIETISAASDELLFGGYRTARFTVFPSINEGFGLPVAESLACGTPVITSNFGSMKEIVDAGGGGLLVDPRDDADVTAAMRTLLTDDAALERLRSQARARQERTWDTYAAETWSVLTAART